MHIAAAGGGQTGSGIIHCQCQCPMKSVNISPHLGLEISTSPNSIFTHMKCVFIKYIDIEATNEVFGWAF